MRIMHLEEFKAFYVAANSSLPLSHVLVKGNTTKVQRDSDGCLTGALCRHQHSPAQSPKSNRLKLQQIKFKGDTRKELYNCRSNESLRELWSLYVSLAGLDSCLSGWPMYQASLGLGNTLRTLCTEWFHNFCHKDQTNSNYIPVGTGVEILQPFHSFLLEDKFFFNGPGRWVPGPFGVRKASATRSVP